MKKYTIFGLISIICAILCPISIFVILGGALYVRISNYWVIPIVILILMIIAATILGFISFKNGVGWGKILGIMGFIINCIILVITILAVIYSISN